jgi:hypothetical protein
VVLGPVCHSGAPVWAIYNKGELSLWCSECDGHVVTVAVAG